MFHDETRFPEFQDETGFPDETTCKVGSAGQILAPAKLNLYLEVLGPRADGFHALESLMVPVRIYDQLFWQDSTPAPNASLSLRVRNLLPESSLAAQLLGRASDNLVLRAARLLAQKAGISPNGRFFLIKRIPIQAGMGGGSSDAAAALMLANTCWKIGYSQQQLMPLAAQLGSDVPFFLSRYFLSRHQSCSAAICRGRGELVEPVTRLPRLHFVVVKPQNSLSTAEVFGHLPAQTKASNKLAAASHSHLSVLIQMLQSGALAMAGRKMTNRLETAAAHMAPWLKTLRETFSQIGCLGHFMTGSGSAYVGVMRTATQARHAARRLANRKFGDGNFGANLNLESVFSTSGC